MKLGILVPAGVEVVVIRHGDGAHGTVVDRLLVVPGAYDTFPNADWVERDVKPRLKEGVVFEHLE